MHSLNSFPLDPQVYDAIGIKEHFLHSAEKKISVPAAGDKFLSVTFTIVH